MQSVRVVVHIDAPIERTFDAVSDHERFLSSDDGTMTTRVVQPGKTERNGLGCLREVRSPPSVAGRRTRYVEEITAWDRPSSFDYRIRETTIPLRHRGSTLAFRPAGRGTEVVWTSRFVITVPLVGRPLGWVARRLFTSAFTSLLQAAKSRLESKSG